MHSLLGGAPAPTFDDPLEMLRACHGRIQAQCSTLTKLSRHLPEHGCDLQAQQAAQAILRYFDTAGRHHHDDEEQDLFPLLLTTDSAAAQPLVARLLQEHLVMDQAWQSLRTQLTAIASGHAQRLQDDTVAHFIDAYERHIALENAQLLPLATDLLNPEQQAALGQRMAARRHQA